MNTATLCELRLLASARFDSQSLLCVILAGPSTGSGLRLTHQLQQEALLPLHSRIRTRLATEHASHDELAACLDHLLASAGNAALMTAPLRHALCDHAAGNYRILACMAAELLSAAAQQELPQLDEKLYFLGVAPAGKATPKRPHPAR